MWVWSDIFFAARSAVRLDKPAAMHSQVATLISTLPVGSRSCVRTSTAWSILLLWSSFSACCSALGGWPSRSSAWNSQTPAQPILQMLFCGTSSNRKLLGFAARLLL